MDLGENNPVKDFFYITLSKSKKLFWLKMKLMLKSLGSILVFNLVFTTAWKFKIIFKTARVGKVRIVTKGGKKFFCHQNIENVLMIIKKE